MFGPVKKSKPQELRRLIWQNSAATELLVEHFRVVGEVEREQLVREILKRSTAITTSGVHTDEDHKALLHMNSELRKQFDYAEANGPEALLRVRFGGQRGGRNFDDVFRPGRGWANF